MICIQARFARPPVRTKNKLKKITLVGMLEQPSLGSLGKPWTRDTTISRGLFFPGAPQVVVPTFQQKEISFILSCTVTFLIKEHPRRTATCFYKFRLHHGLLHTGEHTFVSEGARRTPGSMGQVDGQTTRHFGGHARVPRVFVRRRVHGSRRFERRRA